MTILFVPEDLQSLLKQSEDDDFEQDYKDVFREALHQYNEQERKRLELLKFEEELRCDEVLQDPLEQVVVIVQQEEEEEPKKKRGYRKRKKYGIEYLSNLRYKRYQCNLCDRKFFKSSQLGGHMSSSHPGQSMASKMRNANKKERIIRRYIHQRAKQEFEEQKGVKFSNQYRQLKFIKQELKDMIQSEQQ